MSNKQVFIITGEKVEGKTSLLVEVLEFLQKQNFSLSGFYAKGFWENNKRSAFDMVNIKTGKSIPLCKSKETKNWDKFFNYYFNPEALKAGNQILGDENIINSDLIVVDEIGKLDISGNIWHDTISKITSMKKHNLLIVVRKAFVEDVVNYWKMENVTIFEVGKDDARNIYEKILELIIPKI